jgi:hypothetical protein
MTYHMNKGGSYECVPKDDYDALAARLAEESARLDYLIRWLGFNEDTSQLPVRDWTDNEDARRAIDEARGTDSADEVQK